MILFGVKHEKCFSKILRIKYCCRNVWRHRICHLLIHLLKAHAHLFCRNSTTPVAGCFKSSAVINRPGRFNSSGIFAAQAAKFKVIKLWSG